MDPSIILEVSLFVTAKIPSFTFHGIIYIIIGCCKCALLATKVYQVTENRLGFLRVSFTFF